MRFRKSVKICKGVRINFSKSGVSTTLGTKGFSVNVGKKGTYLNTGIPGTGLHSRQKISGGKTNTKKSTSFSHTEFETISFKLDGNGGMIFYDSLGNIIKDSAKIRKIKSTPSFKAERERLTQELFQEVNEENDKFVNIYQLAPDVYNEKFYIENFEGIILKKYDKKMYTVAKPT